MGNKPGFQISSVFILLALAIAAYPGFAQSRGSVRGTVTDDSGSVIPGANVTLTGSGGKKIASTNELGVFTAIGLLDGAYTLRVTVKGFAPYEDRAVVVTGGRTVSVNVLMKIPAQSQEVTVQSEAVSAVSVDPSRNVGQLVLGQVEIDALPDDPDDLAADLQALAGPSAGPNGGQIYIDGFTGGRLPPKESIREIRINQNPFSSEYEHIGFGRIEILTKPGTDKFRGQVSFGDSDAVLNSRNPYSTNKPDYFSREYGGNVSGPISKRSSFFVDFEKRDIDDNGIIAAKILNPDFSFGSVNTSVLVPNRRTTFSPRIDYQLSTNNTLVGRYSFLRSNQKNSGVGVFDLPTRATTKGTDEDSAQLTETAVLNSKVVNETRFRGMRMHSSNVAVSSDPTLTVSQAFSGGGAQVGNSYSNQNSFEIQNLTSVLKGAHTLKFGLRARRASVESVSPSNFGGAFVYNTGRGPVLDANYKPVLDASGNSTVQTLSSLQRYQRTMILQSMGYSIAQIMALGGGPSQFSIAAGNPKAASSQTDMGAFIQDDWNVRRNLTLSGGLRYEWQNNITDHKDWAPRLGMAWSPDAKASRSGKTVIRAGFGIFYDRFSNSMVLNSIRFNGLNQQQYIVQNPNFLSTPPLASLTLLPQTIYQLDPTLRAPYTVQTAVGVERQLPKNTTVAVNFVDSHSLHQVFTRNIDAPVPGLGIQPFGPGNIYQYESAGLANQNQIMVNVRTQATAKISLFGYYVYGHANSNTDGSFPANQYNLSQDYGRSTGIDERHHVMASGSVSTKWNLRLSPFIIIHSGRAFNITTGRDPYGNSVYTARPSFATSCGGPDVVCNSLGMFNLNPPAGANLIPRNYGNGPAYFTVNLRLSRTWGFGEPRGARYNPASSGGDHGSPGGGFGGGSSSHGSSHGSSGGYHGSHGSHGSSSLTNNRYNVTLSISARNLFNTVNAGTPIGNLGSPLFGQSNQVAGGSGSTSMSANNRRMELMVRFSF